MIVTLVPVVVADENTLLHIIMVVVHLGNMVVVVVA